MRNPCAVRGYSLLTRTMGSSKGRQGLPRCLSRDYEHLLQTLWRCLHDSCTCRNDMMSLRCALVPEKCRALAAYWDPLVSRHAGSAKRDVSTASNDLQAVVL